MIRKILVAAFGLFFLTSANAATLTADSGWTKFYFDGVDGSSWDTTYTFTITEASTLTVTDAYLAGDIFEVFEGGSSLGLTSYTADTTSYIGDDYDAAAVDARWSTGVWQFLTAGTYTITGIVASTPHSVGGGAVIRLDTGATPVPLPAAAWLFLSGIVGVFGLRRRKQQ